MNFSSIGEMRKFRTNHRVVVCTVARQRRVTHLQNVYVYHHTQLLCCECCAPQKFKVYIILYYYLHRHIIFMMQHETLSPCPIFQTKAHARANSYARHLCAVSAPVVRCPVVVRVAAVAVASCHPIYSHLTVNSSLHGTRHNLYNQSADRATGRRRRSAAAASHAMLQASISIFATAWRIAAELMRARALRQKRNGTQRTCGGDASRTLRCRWGCRRVRSSPGVVRSRTGFECERGAARTSRVRM